MRAALSPARLSLIALGLATAVFVWASLRAGLSRRRAALVAGVLLGSPVLLETVNFWSGTLNYALVLLLVAAQLCASVWTRRRFTGDASKNFAVTAAGALLALLTYEIALPFIVATSALYARGWLRRVLTVGLASVAVLAFVAALAAAGLYWPQRFKLAAEQLTSTATETPTANTVANTNTTANAPRASVSERARMYVSLLFSFIVTGLRSPWLWGLLLALAGLCFVSRPAAGEAAREGHLPWDVLACAFALAVVACAGYLALTKSMNARYAAFLLIYGAATLAWTKGRVAACALASLLVVQAAVAAGLPVHLRDVELATRGEAAVSSASGSTDLISVNGRLSRASWGRRFQDPPAVDMLTQPLNSRACRYSVPCEACK
ncbi:MAG: hypothetical protein QOD28_3970 [Acidobacteriota bacterium]|nr:hypothetical protein [Acidobacteriota bacterium]